MSKQKNTFIGLLFPKIVSTCAEVKQQHQSWESMTTKCHLGQFFVTSSVRGKHELSLLTLH